MDVRNLRQVIAIHQQGSFAKAAEILGLAQPSLSKSIARLEDELKVRIFERTATGSQLTPIGEMIVERGKRVIAETHDLIRDAAMIAGGEVGVFRLGVSTLLRRNILPRLLLEITERHPGLHLEIEIGTSDRMLPLLATRELDMVLCARGAGQDENLAYGEFLRIGTVVAAAPNHPLAAERAISVARLADFRCVGPSIEGFTIAELLGLAGENENLSAYMVNDYEPIMPVVCAGLALAVAPSFVVQRYIESGQLTKLDVNLPLRVSFGFVTTRAASYSPIIQKIGRYGSDLGAQIIREWDGLRL